MCIIGTSGWTYPEWRGTFYPNNMSAKNWLQFYSEHFDMVEMNATFYRFFKKENFQRWHDIVPNHFRFIVKAPRIITHRRHLIHCEDVIQEFCTSIKPLGNRLALILLQLAPRTAYAPDRLEKALLAFPQRHKVVVEFRDKKWLTDEVKALLTRLKVVFCATDSPKTDLVSWVTSQTAYIRLHGHKKWYDYYYKKPELIRIAKFAKLLSKKGAKKIYIAFNNDHHAYAVKNARSLKALLERSRLL